MTLGLQVASQSEGDGLTADLTHPLSLSDANTARVAVPPGYPNPVQPVGRKGSYEGRIPPTTGCRPRSLKNGAAPKLNTPPSPATRQ